jgi:hypothetical protein
MFHRFRQVFAEEGLSGVISRSGPALYRRLLRPLVPRTSHLVYGGARVARVRTVLDGVFPEPWAPYELEDVPDYEGALVQALREQVRPGDRVVVVGGGLGVTVVAAARTAGAEGRVYCYEGGTRQARDVRTAARLNGVADRVRVEHAVVARPVAVYGSTDGAAVLPPEDLPECDVLELDCEGSEVDILPAMTIRPRCILVETHGLHGAPTERVAALLRGLSYRVEHRGVAEPRIAEFCRENDIQVLVGLRGEG